MRLVTGYYYDNEINGILISDTAIATINEGLLMYANNLKLFRGMPNTIKLNIKNQDQKPYGLQQLSLWFRLFSPNGKNLVWQGSMSTNLTYVGQATITIPENVIDILPDGQYQYSVVSTDGNGFQSPVYVNDAYGALGIAILENTIVPMFMSSNTVKFSTPVSNLVTTDAIQSIDRPFGANACSTVQWFGNYVGDLIIQTSLDPVITSATVWYNTSTATLTGLYTNGIINTIGKFTFIRVQFDNTNPGSFTKILIRS